MSCDQCGGYGEYNAGTRGSCRDDGDGWVYCNCEAGWRKGLKEGGTRYWVSHSGASLLKRGHVLTEAEYARYQENAKFMGLDVLPNNQTKSEAA